MRGSIQLAVATKGVMPLPAVQPRGGSCAEGAREHHEEGSRRHSVNPARSWSPADRSSRRQTYARARTTHEAVDVRDRGPEVELVSRLVHNEPALAAHRDLAAPELRLLGDAVDLVDEPRDLRTLLERRRGGRFSLGPVLQTLTRARLDARACCAVRVSRDGRVRKLCGSTQ